MQSGHITSCQAHSTKMMLANHEREVWQASISNPSSRLSCKSYARKLTSAQMNTASHGFSGFKRCHILSRLGRESSFGCGQTPLSACPRLKGWGCLLVSLGTCFSSKVMEIDNPRKGRPMWRIIFVAGQGLSDINCKKKNAILKPKPSCWVVRKRIRRFFCDFDLNSSRKPSGMPFKERSYNPLIRLVTILGSMKKTNDC